MSDKTELIREDLGKLSAKYGFKKIIFLGQEIEKETNKEICRVTIFNDQPEFDIHSFALFYEGCLSVSKSFRAIANHLAEHLFKQIVHGITEDDKLTKGGKRAD